MNITESIKFNKVKELIEKAKQEIRLCHNGLLPKTLGDLVNFYENEISEKDKEIEYLKDEIDTHIKEYKLLKINYDELEKSQLFKEGFYKNPYSTGSIDWILVDSSKYDKLPSKEDKTSI
ncbi:hypothetical protein [Spiroplasma endosymbiont of Seladonia tumulorum]|uniref:hypothetical protein n=1 Tax=Spiroplasma endosymbiont of Seladonia tumulorum TaxID=3066321 RepID=UPI0030CB8568